MTVYDSALEQRAESILLSMLAGDYVEDIDSALSQMILRAKLRDPGAVAALEDTTVSDLLAKAARIRAESAVEQDAVSEIERQMQMDLRDKSND